MSLSLKGNIRNIIYIVSAKMINFNVVHGRVVPMIYFFNYLKHIRIKVGSSHCCSIFFANMLLSLQNKRISNTVCIIKHYYCDSRYSNFSMVNIQTTLIIHEMDDSISNYKKQRSEPAAHAILELRQKKNNYIEKHINDS